MMKYFPKINMKNTLSQTLPKDTTIGVLAVTFIVTGFFVVLPSLQALQSMPQHYENILSVAIDTTDADYDGIPGYQDATPNGRGMHAASGL